MDFFRLGHNGLTPSLLEEIRAHAEVVVKKCKSDVETPILDALSACIVELPNKLPVYAVLLACIQEQDADVASSLVALLTNVLNGSDWRRWKAVLRYFAEATKVGCLDPVSVVNLFQNVVKVLDEPNAKEERKDCAVELVLAALPWAASLLHSVSPEQFQVMLERMERYILSERKLRPIATQSCVVFVKECPFEQADSLVLLWSQIKNLSGQNWSPSLILDARIIMPEIPVMAAIPLKESISFPMDNPALTYPPPRAHFEILTPSIVTQRAAFTASLPATPSIDHYLLRDVLEDLAFYFDSNHIEFLNYYNEAVIFQPLGTASQPADDCRYSLHQVMIEVLFAEILRLPDSAHKSIYYGVLIMGLCKAYLKEVPPVLGKVIYTMFERIATVDVECQHRFTQWFAHHLSNFDYRWNWKEWLPAVSAPLDTPQSLMVQELLEKCVRLSYYGRITEAIPKGLDFSPLMPPQPEPVFKYTPSDDPLEQDPAVLSFAQRLLEGMRLKQSFEELSAMLSEIASYGVGCGVGKQGDEMEGMPLAREVLVQCVLHLGCKSFSHMLNMLERHLKLLTWVNATPEAKIETVHIVASFWAKNKQFMMIVLDKFVNYRVIEPNSIMEWVFHEDGGAKDFNRTYPWTMLKTTIQKVNARVHRVARKLESMRKATYDSMDPELGDGIRGDGGADAMDLDAEDVSGVQEELNALQREQKKTYMTVFQHFIRVLSPMLGTDAENTSTFEWTVGMMREVGRCFHHELKTAYVTMEMTVFTPDVPEPLRQLFQGVRSIHS